MKCALLLLINVSAFTALDHVRVWRSRSDLSCHHLDDASHRAVGYLYPPEQTAKVLLCNL